MKLPEAASRLSDISALAEYETFETHLHGFNVGGYLRQCSGDLVFLGGRPGSGKTLLALQVAYEISKYATVLFFSLEMIAEQLKYRLSKDRSFSSKDSELYVYSVPAMTINQMIELMYEQHKTTPLNFVVLDYTQIVQVAGRSKAEEVDTVVTQLKQAALELNVPILAVAQLNRNIETREGNSEYVEPVMSDFADSSSIEKWADCCLIIHRVPKSEGVVKAHCVKNRHGNKNIFTLKLDRTKLRFIDHTEGETV